MSFVLVRGIEVRALEQRFLVHTIRLSESTKDQIRFIANDKMTIVASQTLVNSTHHGIRCGIVRVQCCGCYWSVTSGACTSAIKTILHFLGLLHYTSSTCIPNVAFLQVLFSRVPH